jgi:hypothetical protein
MWKVVKIISIYFSFSADEDDGQIADHAEFGKDRGTLL